MSRIRWVFALALGLSVTVTGVTVGPVMAANPDSTTTEPTYEGTGIAVGPTSQPVDLLISPADIKAKEDQLAAVKSGKGHAMLQNRKLGGGASLAQDGLTPMAACADGYPCSSSVASWFPGLHQKTNYYCLVAFVQSIAYWDVNTSYKTYGTASIRAAQDKIYGTNLGNGIRAYYPDDLTHKGANDYKALAWINGKFATISYTFKYVHVMPTSTASMMGYIRMDIYDWMEANYVRVDLSTYKYKWGQPVSNGVHPLHATGTTGYNDTAVTVSSYDPLAAGPNKVGGVCTSSSYSSTADWACQWTLTQANYYLAIDRSTSISDATNPLWW